MVKNFTTCCILLGFCSVAFNQERAPVRFKEVFFKNVHTQKNILFNTKVEPGSKNDPYLLDIYEPLGDTMLSRPLIIWMHGGGFKFGSKTSRGTPIWSSTFAQRGYICAAINYRLSKKRPLARFPDLADGCYVAIEDLRTALLFLKNNCRHYRIDSNCIILAGNSAGGMIALQSCYRRSPELSKLIQHEVSSVSDTSGTFRNIVAIINFWGALFDIKWLQNAHVPIVSVHGSNDHVVPFNGMGPLYGSAAIHRFADSLLIPNDLKIYAGYGHELQRHFIPFLAGRKVKGRWLQAGQFAADFLYKELFEKLQQHK